MEHLQIHSSCVIALQVTKLSQYSFSKFHQQFFKKPKQGYELYMSLVFSVNTLAGCVSGHL